MSKLIRAVNVMILNRNLISNVMNSYTNKEIFFLYDKKHKWSLYENDSGKYTLHYYPTNLSIEELCAMEDYEWAEFSEMVSYSADELSTTEALNTLSELYRILSEMRYGMDSILNDIIQSDEEEDDGLII